MSDLVEDAKARIQVLEAELRELREFLDVAEKVSLILSGTATAHGVSTVKAVSPDLFEMPPRARVERGSNPKPAIIIAGALEVLKEKGHPMGRRALHKALAARGITVVGADPIKALGTILWRAREQIIYIEGRGYWPASEFVPEVTPDEVMS